MSCGVGPDGLGDLLAVDPGEVGRRVAAGWKGQRNAADELVLCREYEQGTAEDWKRKRERRELPSDVDPHDLKEAGWGVVFSQDVHPMAQAHLQRLLDERKDQAGGRAEDGGRYKEITYYRDESPRRFLWYRNGESAGTLDPRVMPYYLLLVGGPEEIPFDVQYQLSINHAVGRLDFRDPADYRRYVDRVLEAEESGCDLPRRATVFSVENDDDETLPLLSRYLIEPLMKDLTGCADWELARRLPERAYKRDLAELLGGAETPGLLLASCHGKRMPCGHPRQEDWQGALLCQDWPGPKKCSRATPEHFFQAEDLPADADLRGLVAFLFACYGAGTPVLDNFPDERGAVHSPADCADLLIAPRPFTARLPQALLRQGALGVVGHVDRGWTLSFLWEGEGRSITASRSLIDSLKMLLKGDRLGHALRPLVRRYSNLAAQLVEPMEQVRNGYETDEETLGMQWTAHNDARNFILLGDPAVYLLGKRCWHEREERAQPGSMRLDPDLLRQVEEKARAVGMGVEEWVSEVLRRRLGELARESAENLAGDGASMLSGEAR